MLLVNGDAPLLRAETVTRLVREHLRAGSALTVLTAAVDDPTGLGRIVRDDDGAVRAIVERQASLLAAGVTRVTGSFGAGEPVDLVVPRGRVVARGLAGFDSEDVGPMLGRSTHDLVRELGGEYDRELVHRDDLVVL